MAIEGLPEGFAIQLDSIVIKGGGEQLLYLDHEGNPLQVEFDGKTTKKIAGLVQHNRGALAAGGMFELSPDGSIVNLGAVISHEAELQAKKGFPDDASTPGTTVGPLKV